MTGGRLALTVALLVANGLFVAVEFAVIASRRTKLEALAAAGSARARAALRATRDLNTQLAAAQLGITMASLVLGYVAEPAVSGLIEDGIARVVDVPVGVLHTTGFVVALVIVAFLHMVIGEMVPKNIALAAPEATLELLVLPNRAYIAAFRPLLRGLNGIAGTAVRAVGIEPADELSDHASVEELRVMLRASREEGLIADLAHRLSSDALGLGEQPVTTVLVPPVQVRWLPRSATAEEAEALAMATGFTRLPVRGADEDAVLGFVHAKDLLLMDAAARDRPIPGGRIRPMPELDPSMSLDEAMSALRNGRTHMAQVHDATGRLLGIVTLERVIEALVGDITDESDR